MKFLLFGYHDNQPMNKYFFIHFADFGLKTTSFLNTHKKLRMQSYHNETWWTDSLIHA